MARIHRLDEKTINQIAAGEVVENPSSALKELIENSLDAGATQLWIEIRGGGFQLIRVADNGVGMNEDDARLCFERHTTSKIRDIQDLSALLSMGFRGEALASIASISQMDLVTCQTGCDALEIQVEAGHLIKCQKSSRPPGSTFSVRSLFYNVPARKKFQKSVSASTHAIHKLITLFSLAHPHVGFELKIDGTVTFSNLPQENKPFIELIKDRLKDVFDPAFINSCRWIDKEKEGYRVQGFIGSSAHHRTHRSEQYLFVNTRAVTSSMVSYAVKAGYGYRLDERRYPIFALYLTLPPEEVDVNVHPQKKEVRFQHEDKLRQLVQKAVQDSFETLSMTSSPSVDFSTFDFEEPSLRFKESDEHIPSLWEEEAKVIGMIGPYLLIDASSVAGKNKEGILWVHLQKAQEKLITQKLKDNKNASQKLLIPIPVSLTQREALELEEKKALLHSMGFEIDLSGKGQYLIQAIPSFIENLEAEEALKQVIASTDENQKIASFAVRKKKEFMLQEALAIWHQIKDSGDSECIAKMEWNEIQKLFR